MSSSVKFITITEFQTGLQRMIRLSQIREIIPVRIPILGTEKLVDGPLYHIGCQIHMTGRIRTRFGSTHEIIYSREPFENIQKQITH